MFEFNANNSLGAQPSQAIADYLLDIGAIDDAGLFTGGGVDAQGALFPDPPYKHTGMVVGFLSPEGKIVSASGLEPDRLLINQRIRVTLDRFYVESYPGSGNHTIVCEFNGKNQVQHDAEALKFATKLVVADQAAAASVNVPIFLGLTVSADGLAFEGRTINVRSNGSEAILDALESSVFRSGLALINLAQPALKPFVSLAAATIKTLESRSRNKQVHHFNLGLDFSDRPTSTCLRLGTYIIAQADATDWDWASFEWSPDSMLLRDRRKNAGQSVGFNYTVIGISRFESAISEMSGSQNHQS
nr:hypothetical protein [Alcaligenes faecalis]